ncbi:hypothetical protein EV368DRAFT_80274 [Lentinula lateritia]|nr:hypothetical protein EV368DRAFT_80274 [Lentinula lateritia]
MSVRTVQTSFTSHSASTAALSTMIATSNVLTAVDLNVAYPPGLESYRADKGLVIRGRSYSGSAARNSYPHQASGGPNLSASRSSNRAGSNKRYPHGMRLPSSSYNQTQNQTRRAGFSSSTKQENSLLSPSFYQRTERFDPFGDSKEPPQSTSPVFTSTGPSNASQPLYTHYYYYDPSTNRPTLAYADDKNSANAANLTASTNLLLDTLLNGRRSPSPPQSTMSDPSASLVAVTADSPVQPQTRSPSPPHSLRPRAAAISRPSSTITPSPILSQPIASVSPPPPPIKVSKAQRDAIARIVANMLLNRADGISRRGRRCNNTGYVKSGLSRVVSVE